MRAVVDADTCTGCGLCTETCPEIFDMTDDLATAKPGDVPAERAYQVTTAFEAFTRHQLGIETLTPEDLSAIQANMPVAVTARSTMDVSPLRASTATREPSSRGSPTPSR